MFWFVRVISLAPLFSLQVPFLRPGSYGEKGWSKLRKYYSSGNGELPANDIRIYRTIFFMVISFGYLGSLRNNLSYPSYKKRLRT